MGEHDHHSSPLGIEFRCASATGKEQLKSQSQDESEWLREMYEWLGAFTSDHDILTSNRLDDLRTYSDLCQFVEPSTGASEVQSPGSVAQDQDKTGAPHGEEEEMQELTAPDLRKCKVGITISVATKVAEHERPARPWPALVTANKNGSISARRVEIACAQGTPAVDSLDAENATFVDGCGDMKITAGKYHVWLTFGAAVQAATKAAKAKVKKSTIVDKKDWPTLQPGTRITWEGQGSSVRIPAVIVGPSSAREVIRWIPKDHEGDIPFRDCVARALEPNDVVRLGWSKAFFAHDEHAKEQEGQHGGAQTRKRVSRTQSKQPQAKRSKQQKAKRRRDHDEEEAQVSGDEGSSYRSDGTSTSSNGAHPHPYFTGVLT